jgi:hypothetical protein
VYNSFCHKNTKEGVQCFSKDKDKRPLDIITEAVKAAGFTESKTIETLGVLIQSMALPEFRGKMVDFEQTRMKSRRACTSFLSDEAKCVKETLQKKVWENVRQEFDRLTALGQNPATYIFTDDTICEFNPPSSSSIAGKCMEGGGYHFSHTTGRTVYGHQVLTIHVAIGKKTFLLDLFIYESGLDKENQDAVDIEYIAAKAKAMVIENEITEVILKKYNESAGLVTTQKNLAARKEAVTQAAANLKAAKLARKSKKRGEDPATNNPATDDPATDGSATVDPAIDPVAAATLSWTRKRKRRLQRRPQLMLSSVNRRITTKSSRF